MAVNYTPDYESINGNMKTLKPFRFWCQKVLPLVYDDSLSYYELLNKVVQYLNDTMENVDGLNDNVNTLDDNVRAIYQAYNQLQDYVNNYFDNLDVQVEINNKLDEMVIDGTLSTLISSIAVPMIPELVSDWLDENIQPTTPIVDATLTISGAAADAKVCGDNFIQVKRSFNSIIDINKIESDDLESGYYSSSNGSKIDSDSYLRVPYLMPINGGCYYCSNTDGEIQGAVYDESGTFIKRVYIEPSNGRDPYLDFIPTSAAFIGLYFKTTETVTDHISLRKLEGYKVNVCEYPFTDKNTIYTVGKYMGSDGVVRNDTGLALLTLADIKEGERYYYSAQGVSGVCLDSSNNVLTTAYEDVAPFGRIYTVPVGAKRISFNIRLADKKGVNDEPNNYISKITKNEKILCIGDSITWLDGRTNYGGMRNVSGWQMMLRKAGYDVRSAGFSGEPYATGLDIVDGVDYSIYKRIVTNEYDVTGYDFIIMFGGTNDVLYGGAIGDRPTVYTNRTFDPSKFNGAISAIIDYIRTNNPTAVILLASFPKSEALSRTYVNASLRVREIEYEADFWSCKYINIFDDMNVQPTYEGFDEFFYDTTHPNYNGMVRIGKIMSKALSEYE